MELGLDCGLGCKYTIPHGSGSKWCQQDSNRTAFWSAKQNYSLLGQVDSHSGLDRSEFTYIQFGLSLGWVGGWLDLGPAYLSFIPGIDVVILWLIIKGKERNASSCHCIFFLLHCSMTWVSSNVPQVTLLCDQSCQSCKRLALQFLHARGSIARNPSIGRALLGT